MNGARWVILIAAASWAALFGVSWLLWAFPWIGVALFVAAAFGATCGAVWFVREELRSDDG